MERLLAFLRLFRWQNLLMVLYTLAAFQYTVIHPLIVLAGEEPTLRHLNFALLCLASILLAAAGNVINDVFDQGTDRHNRPEKLIIGRYIGQNSAMNLYHLLNLSGIAVGIYLVMQVGRLQLAGVFVMVAGLLWFYSTNLKRTPLLGNVVVSFLVAFVIVILVLFERKLFAAEFSNERLMRAANPVFLLMIGYGSFAFLVNLLRELVKDVEDLEGDRVMGFRTLAVILAGRIKHAILALTLVILSASAWVQMMFYSGEAFERMWIVLILIQAPLIALIPLTRTAKHKHDWKRISWLCKWILFAGVSTLWLFHFLKI